MRLAKQSILAAVASLAQFAAACPMCKDTVATAKSAIAGPVSGSNASGGTGSIASGFNISVYMMLAAFLFALGIVAFNLGRGMRK